MLDTQVVVQLDLIFSSKSTQQTVEFQVGVALVVLNNINIESEEISH